MDGPSGKRPRETKIMKAARLGAYLPAVSLNSNGDVYDFRTFAAQNMRKKMFSRFIVLVLPVTNLCRPVYVGCTAYPLTSWALSVSPLKYSACAVVVAALVSYRFAENGEGYCPGRPICWTDCYGCDSSNR